MAESLRAQAVAAARQAIYEVRTKRERNQRSKRPIDDFRADDEIIVDAVLTMLAFPRGVPTELSESDGKRLRQVGWLGPYGIIPGDMDNDPHPSWHPIYVRVEY